jgi:hypothetical protein
MRFKLISSSLAPFATTKKGISLQFDFIES